MKHNSLILFGLTISGLAALGVENSWAATNGITPDALVGQALKQNPELSSYVEGIAAAKGGLKTAGTIRNPEFNAQAGYKNARDESGGTSGDGAAWSVSLNQTFEY